ncbi:glycosyltransferase [Thermoleptolyngbya sichuanensis XZ-Cy5]|uniref:glycosyltransferase n=1 Tax=Thermoleptolyngbya sichuanensis TaxID=2885951 RepID=UPI00240D2663|nr:glycosyltransferase [Thermoleptolyngbya sichuanensis]MDG2616664.1 glycosyltransferase [Thermoleptolyngbya sichuanensis XZ-Cy5]
MTIAYLVNQYPKVSHSFIRREILALEAAGMPVARFSVRSCSGELVDPGDQAERHKTQVILSRGVSGLLTGLIQTALAHPGQFLKALAFTLKISRRGQRGLAHHLAYLAEACILRREFEIQGITHVHAHFGTNSTTVAMLCHALGGPTYSFTVHGPEEFDRPEALLLPEKIRRAAAVVAISAFGKSQLMRWCEAADWRKIQVVHCGVDEEFLTQAATPVPETQRLVCVGRLSEQKGHLLLLEAIAPLAAEGIPFKLVLVGDGELRPQVEAAIAQYGLESYVEITGWASSAEVRQQLQTARALVLPSFAEGLPVVLMEALALARPVVSTYVAGIPELVEPGRSGWLVPPGAVEDLTAALREVLQADTKTLSAMGHHGRSRVVQQHNAATEARKLAALFQQIEAEARLSEAIALPDLSQPIPEG